jgi:hypothetical protein
MQEPSQFQTSGETSDGDLSERMQRVRFSSSDDYEKFKIVFGDVRHHLKTLPGFT